MPRHLHSPPGREPSTLRQLRPSPGKTTPSHRVHATGNHPATPPGASTLNISPKATQPSAQPTSLQHRLPRSPTYLPPPPRQHRSPGHRNRSPYLPPPHRLYSPTYLPHPTGVISLGATSPSPLPAPGPPAPSPRTGATSPSHLPAPVPPGATSLRGEVTLPHTCPPFPRHHLPPA